MAKHLCDVAVCTGKRLRWQRICTRCYNILPRHTAKALIAAYRAADKPTWRTLCKESGRILADHLAAQTRRAAARDARLGRTFPPITAQQAFANTQRLLGEQD